MQLVKSEQVTCSKILHTAVIFPEYLKLSIVQQPCVAVHTLSLKTVF